MKESDIEFEGDKECSLCQRAGRPLKKMKGVFFNKNEDLKEDIFYSKILGSAVFVSQRFKDFIEENNFMNLKVIPAETYEPEWLQHPLKNAKIIWKKK